MKDAYTLEDLRCWEQATAGEQPPLRLSVFGDPVSHSRSPQMHNPALAACGIDARYCRLHIKGGDALAEALRLLPRNGFIGTNVTLPHKAATLELMDAVDDHARKMGAVNTVRVEGDRLIGFNTDGPGFVRAIRAEFEADVRDLRVMVLGAGGGAGRAIATQCAIENCERLVLVNRTFEKAGKLANELESLFQPKPSRSAARLRIIPWDQETIGANLADIDLVINATSCGMNPADPPLLEPASLLPHLMVYDTIYTADRTRLLADAEIAGARAANGLSLLVFQGALSFEIWFHRPAPIEAMRAGLAS